MMLLLSKVQDPILYVYIDLRCPPPSIHDSRHTIRSPPLGVCGVVSVQLSEHRMCLQSLTFCCVSKQKKGDKFAIRVVKTHTKVIYIFLCSSIILVFSFDEKQYQSRILAGIQHNHILKMSLFRTPSSFEKDYGRNNKVIRISIAQHSPFSSSDVRS